MDRQVWASGRASAIKPPILPFARAARFARDEVSGPRGIVGQTLRCAGFCKWRGVWSHAGKRFNCEAEDKFGNRFFCKINFGDQRKDCSLEKEFKTLRLIESSEKSFSIVTPISFYQDPLPMLVFPWVDIITRRVVRPHSLERGLRWAQCVWEETGLTHGDLTPWNVVEMPGGRNLIIDWERAISPGIPAYDVFYSAISSSILLLKAPFTFQAANARRLIRKYSKNLTDENIAEVLSRMEKEDIDPRFCRLGRRLQADLSIT